MALPGEDDEVTTPAEEVSTGSEGTERPEGDDGQEELELPAEHADDPADDGEPQDDEVDAQPERPVSRGERRYQRLANETKEAKDRAERAEREIRELRQAQYQRDNTLSERDEAERIALMTPAERTEYGFNKFKRESLQREQQREFRFQAEIDKAKFEAKATLKPVYAKYADEVEERFQELASKGQATEREVILKFILGERALNGADAAARKGKAAGQKRVDAQRVSNGSAKGDTKSGRGKAGSTPEERLRGVLI